MFFISKCASLVRNCGRNRASVNTPLKASFGLGGFQAEVKNKESTKPLGESVEARGQYFKAEKCLKFYVKLSFKEKLHPLKN